MTDLSPNAIRILDAVRMIPRGSVASYAQVAARAGMRGRARLVAWALKQASDDLPVPWHRVLRADGRIAFAEGSDARAEQLRLLKREKITLCNGRVPPTKFAWRADDDLDASVWGPDRQAGFVSAPAWPDRTIGADGLPATTRNCARPDPDRRRTATSSPDSENPD